jgi:hypothetical protein
MTNRYEVEINFLADGSDFLRSQLQAMGYSASATESPEQVSLNYFNLLKRLIPSYPRQVTDIKDLRQAKIQTFVQLEEGVVYAPLAVVMTVQVEVRRQESNQTAG